MVGRFALVVVLGLGGLGVALGGEMGSGFTVENGKLIMSLPTVKQFQEAEELILGARTKIEIALAEVERLQALQRTIGKDDVGAHLGLRVLILEHRLILADSHALIARMEGIVNLYQLQLALQASEKGNLEIVKTE